MDRLLWIVPKWPLPMQDGARVANVNLMKGLTDLGVKLDLIAVAGEDELCDVGEIRRVCGVSDCFVVRRKATENRFGLKGALGFFKLFLMRPWLAVTLAPFSTSEVRAQISSIIEKGHWKTLVYDGLHPAAHSSRMGLYCKPEMISEVIYRAHNVEAEIWGRKAAQTGLLPLKLFLKFQTFLMKRFEDSLVRRSKAVMTVSEVDLDLFRKSIPELRGTAVPIGYDFGAAPVSPSGAGGDKVLFLGRLDWPPNRDGLIWLLDEVWPEVRHKRSDLELWIAGSGNSDWLKARGQMDGVKFLGRVESVDDAYRSSLLSLVPVFYGSGTRVKAIEASRYGRACLSTAVGIEGLGLEAGKTFIQAETAAEWIEALVQLKSDRATEMGLKAHESLKRAFHLPAAAQKFLDSV